MRRALFAFFVLSWALGARAENHDNRSFTSVPMEFSVPDRQGEPVPKAKGDGPSSCLPLEPGRYLSGPAYRGHIEALEKGFSLERLGQLNAAADQEAARAMYAVFSQAKDAQTRVFYSRFSTGDNRNNHDGGDGFRVIWQRTVNGRLLSVITFWEHDGRGGFRLIGGADGIRVRVQVGEAAGQRVPPFVALSYQVTQENGRVTALNPGVYQQANGTQAKTQPEVTSHSNATSCGTCHSTFPNRGLADSYFNIPRQPASTIENPLFEENQFHTSQPAQQFIEHALEPIARAGRPGVRNSLETALRNPRITFVPPGLLDALEAKCRAFPRPPNP